MIWRATNSARVRFPLSAETQSLLASVQMGGTRALGVSFSDPMIRAILRGAKEQTSRRSPIRGWTPGKLVRMREACVLKRDAFEYRADGAGNWLVEWRPAMFAPRASARLLLRATRLPYSKRLGDFDGDDVLREGCPIPSDDPAGGLSFVDVWKLVNAGKYDEDAIVWIHRFEVLR